jgi:hypothetical protein
VAAQHGVLDIIAMGLQTVDDVGNERRKKCINLYSPDQDNRDVRLASVNIIENRGGKFRELVVHLCEARSLFVMAWLNSVNGLTRYILSKEIFTSKKNKINIVGWG